MNRETQSFRSREVVDHTSTFREMEQITKCNDNLLEEIQQMKRDVIF